MYYILEFLQLDIFHLERIVEQELKEDQFVELGFVQMLLMMKILHHLLEDSSLLLTSSSSSSFSFWHLVVFVRQF